MKAKQSQKLKQAIKELSNKTYKAVTLLEKCLSCGTCIKYCPLRIRKYNNNHKAITINNNLSCGGCSVCYHRCPNNAIILKPIVKQK